MSFVVAVVVMMAFFGFVIFGFKRFDAMLYRIYDTDKERWKSLGQPMGYFWMPKDKIPFFGSTMARDAFFFAFLAAGMKDPAPPTPGAAGHR